jgi:chemotaxis protein MotB
MRNYYPIVIIAVFLCSCVSKKEYLATLQTAKITADSLQFHIDSSQEVIQGLRLNVAHLEGAKEALFETQDKLQDRIIGLDDEIERLLSESATRVETMDMRLGSQDATIQKLEQKIGNVQSLIHDREASLATIEVALKDTLNTFPPAVFDLNFDNGSLVLSFGSDFLFYPGSTTKLNKTGEEAIANVARILLNYPRVEVLVVGHTDNSPLKRRSINNKWEYSSLRASTLVHLMTRQYDLSTSRVMAAGKGDFAPRASNATEEGRALNDRMEIIITTSRGSLLRDLQRRLDEE